MMWRQIRLQVGGASDCADMLATVNFAAASTGATRMVFQTARIGGCHFHLGKSARRRVQRLAHQVKYGAEEGFRLRAKMPSAAAFLPQEDIRRAFGEIST